MMLHQSCVSRLALVVFACAALGASTTARAQTAVVIPNSPAGTLLKPWLDAFNAGDSVGLHAFSKAHFPHVSAQAHLQMQRRMGGLELVRIINAEPSRLVVRGGCPDDGPVCHLESLTSSIRRAIAKLDRGIAVASVRTMPHVVAEYVSPWRLLSAVDPMSALRSD